MNAGDVEIVIAEYVGWFNHRRLHGANHTTSDRHTSYL